MRGLFLALILMACLLGLASARSGLPWVSGAAFSSNARDPAEVNQLMKQIHDWEQFRRRPLDIYNSKANSNQDWDALLSSINDKAGLYRRLYNESIAIEQVIDFIVEKHGASGNALTACKNGQFDSYHRTIAQKLASYPRRSPFIIRLGHELNANDAIFGPAHDPNAGRGDYSTYKDAFCHIAGIYKRAIPNLLIDWNWLRKPGNIDPDAAYPGPSCLDIIGADTYANKEEIRTDQDFHDYANAKTREGWPAGPQSWINYAKLKGKKCGFAEWGVTNPNHGGVYDSAAYIRGMYNMFRDNAAQVVYESYFDLLDDHTGDHRLNDPSGNNPNATNEYKKQWSKPVRGKRIM